MEDTTFSKKQMWAFIILAFIAFGGAVAALFTAWGFLVAAVAFVANLYNLTRPPQAVKKVFTGDPH